MQTKKYQTMIGVLLLTLLLASRLAFAASCIPAFARTGPAAVFMSQGGTGSGCIVNGVSYTTIYSFSTAYTILFGGFKTGPTTVDIQGAEYASNLNVSITFITGTSTNITATFNGTLSIRSFPLCGANLWQTNLPVVKSIDVVTQSTDFNCFVDIGDELAQRFVSNATVPLSTITPLPMSAIIAFEINVLVTATGNDFALINITLSDSNIRNNFIFNTGSGTCTSFALLNTAEGCTTTESQTESTTESPSQSQTSSPSQSPSESPSESHSPPPSHTNSDSESQAASNSNSESNSATAAIVNDVEHRLTGIELMATVMAALIVFAAVMSCPMMFA